VCSSVVSSTTIHALVKSIGITASQNSLILFQELLLLLILASPEVKLTANTNSVNEGDMVSLTCTVLQGNPMSYSYTELN